MATKQAKRICAKSRERGYCGRHSAPTTTKWSEVTCRDCIAAHHADGFKKP